MKSFYTFLLCHQKIIFLALTIAAGILILYPLHNFQAPLTQGDHGRDLYAFKQTLDGALPYRDYWWVYGPLMPYYYAAAYKILGISIQSILLGELLLKIGAGVFFYLCLSLFCAPVFALLGACWFFLSQPDFFHTYNHAGGILSLLMIVYFLFCYLKNPQKKYIFAALTVNFFLFFIKINIGLYAFCGSLLSLILFDWIKKKKIKNWQTYLATAILLPIIICAIHWIFFLKGLPLYAIRQCFPVLAVDHLYDTPLLPTFFFFIKMQIFSILSNQTSLLLASLASILGLVFFLKKPLHPDDRELKRNLFLALVCLLLFTALVLHEFLATGVLYSLFWVNPFQNLFLFLLIGTGIQKLAKPLQTLLVSVLFAICCIFIFNYHLLINSFKSPYHYFDISKTKIYIENSFDWILTVKKTTQYLNDHLTPQETFFALPYDPIYYFLTNKTSPTRHLIFFKHDNIPAEQEHATIKDLEKNNIRYIVLSSRQSATEIGLGTFGKTHCSILAEYINKHFSAVATFGDWTGDPTKILHHGTKILKRKLQ